ncbi:MAG: tetratricopeptide repeat protein [Spongiibacteraceae bacterium]
MNLVFLLSACGSNSPQDAAQPVEISPATRTNFATATAAMKAQQWSEAEAQFKQLVQAQPNLSGAYLNLALIYAQTHRAADAETQFKKALEVNPENWSARDQYGIWLRTQGRFKEAETIYLQTLQRQPERADTHLNLGILYDLYFGKSAQALEHYQQYLTLKGDSADAEVGRVKNWVADLQRRNKAGG